MTTPSWELVDLAPWSFREGNPRRLPKILWHLEIAEYTSQPSLMRARLFISAAVGAALLAALLASPSLRDQVLLRREDSRSGLLELIRARRPEAGRFGGSAAPDSAPIPSQRELLRLTKLVEKEDGNSLEALKDRALLSLADGKSDLAVALMEKVAAARGGSAKAEALSDLASVYLSRAASATPYDLVLALESASEALQRAPSLLEAQFNRALALQKLFLTSSARATWEGLIEKEASPGWKKIEQRHLATLTGGSPWPLEEKRLESALGKADPNAIEAIVGLFPQHTRTYAQQTLLARWAKEQLSRETDTASRSLQGAYWLGEALEAANGDRSVADAVAAIRNAGNDILLDRLAKAHLAYSEGLSLYDQDQAKEAQKCLQEAVNLFRQAEAPTGWAEYWLAVTEYYTSDRDQALRHIEKLLGRKDLAHAPSLRGRLLWTKGLARLVEARFDEALEYQRSALAEFDRLGEQENSGAQRWLMSETLTLLGDRDAAWALRLDALRNLHPFPSSLWLHNLLLTAGQALLNDGHPLAARNFADEILNLSVESRVTPLSRAQTRILKARIAGRLKDAQGAFAELREARAEALRVPDTTFRNRVLADALLVESEIRRPDDPAVARELAAKAIDYYLEKRLLNRSAYARLLRADASLAFGDFTAAADDFEHAIEEREQAGRALRNDEMRIAFLDQWQILFDNMVELEAQERADPARAFAFIERAKTTAQGTLPLTLQQVRQSLPESVTVVEYASLREWLLIWVITKQGWDFVKVPVGVPELERLTDGMLKSMESCAGEDSLGEADRLYETLVKPLDGIVGNPGLLVLVPDKGLSRIPFAALRDPGSRKYLIERAAILMEPSASHFIEGLSSSNELAESPRTLVVGDPAFDRQAFPAYTRLPGSAAEATQIAALYRGSDLVTEEAATRGAILAALATHNIVHMAGHSIADPRTPALSKFLTAKEAAAGSALYLHDLQDLRLNHVQLMILSACSTAPGSQSRGEGFAGFARPLLASGVHSVLTSLWRINDDETSLLLVRFHRCFLEGQDSASALRESQLSFLRSSNERLRCPRVWAAFQLTGNSPGIKRRNEQ